jgi:phosphoribosylformylglycinamidine synthase subunit PurQ / glutaminase
MITIGVIQFPGSNCERETHMALERSGMQGQDIFWQDARALENCDGFVIVGGFSYEDRVRSGLIAAQAPIMNALKLQADMGKPVLGICNGAQVLVESGMVPGFKNYPLSMALAHNKRMKHGELLGTGFYNAWVHVKTDSDKVFGWAADKPLHIPMAHAEGRFMMTDETYAALKDAGAGIWQYCDADGAVDEHFPTNPNGSKHNIAAISNFAGNVLAMMPHPERTEKGDAVFAGMKRSIEQGPKTILPSSSDVILGLDPEIHSKELAGVASGNTRGSNQNNHLAQQDTKPSPHNNLFISMVINDNEAVSLENALNQLGYDVKLTKYTHWQIDADEKLKQAIIGTGELFNPNKEFIDTPAELKNGFSVLTQDKENLKGVALKQLLHKQYQLDIPSLTAGKFWQVDIQSGDADEVRQALLDKHVFGNPLSDRVSSH